MSSKPTLDDPTSDFYGYEVQHQHLLLHSNSANHKDLHYTLQNRRMRTDPLFSCETKISKREQIPTWLLHYSPWLLDTKQLLSQNIGLFFISNLKHNMIPIFRQLLGYYSNTNSHV